MPRRSPPNALARETLATWIREGGPRALLAIAVAGLVASSSACSLYHRAPLPPLSSLASGRPLEPASLQARIDEIDHPILKSQAVVLSDGIGPMEAALLAVVLNPDLAAARARRGEARAGVIAAGILPNPVFGGGLDRPYGTGSAGLADVVSLSLSIDSQRILTRWARLAVARGELEQVDLDVAWQEWQVAQAARLEAVRLAWLERRVALAREQLAQEEETTARLGHAYDARDATVERLGVQLAARETVRANVMGLEEARTRSRSALLALWGQPAVSDLRMEPPGPAEVSAPVPETARVAPLCLERRIDLVALRRGHAAQDARVRQAVIEQLPDVSIGIAHQRDESSLRFFGGFVSLSVPVFDRNQATVALAVATRERLALEYEARVASVRSTLDETLGILRMLQHRLPEVASAVGPLARLERSERAAAETGDVSWLSYATLRVALLEQRLQEAALSQLAAETRIGIDTACGTLDWQPPAPEERG
ncbi:MAG TPA: hypothetical protein VKB65_09490 [Myxococcota bacterium]|nr:hypothetical protein [Myxococcota bacterium]